MEFRQQLLNEYLEFSDQDFTVLQVAFHQGLNEQVKHSLIKLQGTTSLVEGKTLEASIKAFKTSPSQDLLELMAQQQQELNQAIKVYLSQLA